MNKPRYITKEEQMSILSALSYNPDTGIFKWEKPRSGIKVGDVAGSKDNKGYIRIRFNNNLIAAHRLAFLFMGQTIPDYVDHIDGIEGNNKWGNLRVCNKSQNAANTGKYSNNRSGYKGVSWHKNTSKWKAQIKVNGKKIHLGYYDCPIDAHKAYQKAANKYHGVFKNYG